MSYRAVPVVLLCAACGNVSPATDAPTGSTPDAAISDAPVLDAPGPDAPAPDAPGPQGRCDPAKPFAMPGLVSELSSSNNESGLALTRDELTAFVGRIVQVGADQTPTILAAHRTSISAAFSEPTTVVTAAINGKAGDEHSPSSVADGLILYFHRQDPGGGAIEILAATRADGGAAFDTGTDVTVDGSGLNNAISPTISADGQTLYWLDFIDFGMVFSATRGSTPNLFVNKRAASTIAIATAPVLSADELTMYYATGNGDDVLVSTRANKAESFGAGVPVENVNSAANDVPLALTRDGCVLYLASTRGGLGGSDLWEARRPR